MVLKWQPQKLKSSIKLQNLHSMDENNANFCHAILSKCLKFKLEKLFLMVAALQPQCLVISSYFRYNCQQEYGLSSRFNTADRNWARYFQQNNFLSEKKVAFKSEVFWEKSKNCNILKRQVLKQTAFLYISFTFLYNFILPWLHCYFIFNTAYNIYQILVFLKLSILIIKLKHFSVSKIKDVHISIARLISKWWILFWMNNKNKMPKFPELKSFFFFFFPFL